jgi:gliding motility-associated-like protein
MKRVFLIFIFLLFYWNSFSQQLFYSDILYGGVTGNGGSVANGSGTITLNLSIPQNSTIKKAYLLAARDSLADDITVTLNGFNYTFSNATIITSGFNAVTNLPLDRPNSSMHAIEITSDIDSSINSYSITIPPQFNGIKGAYMYFYLYVVFENPLLPKINCNLFLNTQDAAGITSYNLNNLMPINNNKPVSLAVAATYFCDTILDGSYVQVNNDTLGVIGGEDLNSNLWTCVGAWANFAHYNDSLFGLDDDTADSLMAATDALADIKSYVNNGDTAVNVTFTYQTLNNSNGGILTNPIRAVMLSYSTPCDTFTTTITANDSICMGSNLQLQATGGSKYSWFSAFGGLSDTSIANPVATPTQTTTYIVTITNDSGCVKTEQVKIWVNPLPEPDTLIVTNNFCGDSVGSLQVGNVSSNTGPYSYDLTNLQTLITQSQISNLFTGLSTGDYLLQITDANGCQFTDTVSITETNNVQANFTANPSSGSAPLLVDFMNTSQNATNYFWEITNERGDTINQIPVCTGMTVNCGMQYTFDSLGAYQVCLVAYNNIPTCADTVCKTIIVNEQVDSLIIIIPNIFTPNNDGNNDHFVLQISGVSLIKELKIEIFNRWGILVKSNKFKVESSQHSSPTTQYTIWDGRTTAAKLAPEGTYFYVINYIKLDGELKTEKGTVTLLR